MSEETTEHAKLVAVNADALYQVLTAINGPGHLIRELRCTRGPLVGECNPINILIAEYNAAINAPAALSPPPDGQMAADARKDFDALRRYLDDTLVEGTASEREVARTSRYLLDKASPPP